MATPKTIVGLVAANTGVPEATVTVHDRNLLMAGLRTEGQRGRGKSSVTFEDAANLLIAVAASRNVKDSAAMVRLYAPLVARTPPAWGDKTWGRTFGEAITELLEAVPANRDDFGGENANRITISIFGPRPHAKIEVWVKPTEYDQPPAHVFQYEQRSTKGEIQRFADLTFIAQFTQVTLGLVGEALVLDMSAAE